MKKVYIALILLMTFFVGNINVSAEDYYTLISPDSKNITKTDEGDICKYSFQFNYIDYELTLYVKQDRPLSLYDIDNDKKYSIPDQFIENYISVGFQSCPDLFYHSSYLSKPIKDIQFFSNDEMQTEIGVSTRDYKKALSNDEKSGRCYITTESNDPFWIDRDFGLTHFDFPDHVDLKADAKTKSDCELAAFSRVNTYVKSTKLTENFTNEEKCFCKYKFTANNKEYTACVAYIFDGGQIIIINSEGKTVSTNSTDNDKYRYLKYYNMSYYTSNSDRKCIDLYYKPKSIDVKNPEFFITDDGLYPYLCFYKCEKNSKCEYKWTRDDLGAYGNSWHTFLNADTEEKCKNLVKEEEMKMQDIYSEDENSGDCYVCESTSTPYSVWLKDGYKPTCNAPAYESSVTTKQACMDAAKNYPKTSTDGKSCYICRPSSEYAYAIWTKSDEVDSQCSDYIFSPLEKSEYACFEEAKNYRIKNGGPVDYTPPQKGKVKSCGGKDGLKNIPARLVDIVNAVVTIIQIVVPIILIILGMIDFAKAAVSQKEDEINKGKKVFFSRLITGLILFLVVLIVKMAVGFVSEATDNSKIVSCIDCFISGKCQ